MAIGAKKRALSILPCFAVQHHAVEQAARALLRRHRGDVRRGTRRSPTAERRRAARSRAGTRARRRRPRRLTRPRTRRARAAPRRRPARGAARSVGHARVEPLTPPRAYRRAAVRAEALRPARRVAARRRRSRHATAAPHPAQKRPDDRLTAAGTVRSEGCSGIRRRKRDGSIVSHAACGRFVGDFFARLALRPSPSRSVSAAPHQGPFAPDPYQRAVGHCRNRCVARATM